jgi:hypothetical protein
MDASLSQTRPNLKRYGTNLISASCSVCRILCSFQSAGHILASDRPKAPHLFDLHGPQALLGTVADHSALLLFLHHVLCDSGLSLDCRHCLAFIHATLPTSGWRRHLGSCLAKLLACLLHAPIRCDTTAEALLSCWCDPTYCMRHKAAGGTGKSTLACKRTTHQELTAVCGQAAVLNHGSHAASPLQEVTRGSQWKQQHHQTTACHVPISFELLHPGTAVCMHTATARHSYLLPQLHQKPPGR